MFLLYLNKLCKFLFFYILVFLNLMDSPESWVLKEDSRLHFENLIDGTDPNLCITFVMNEEDHTLGNAVRFAIINWQEVEFCGYSVPHPSLNKINVRIQSKKTTPTKILSEGLNSLREISKALLEKLEDEPVA